MEDQRIKEKISDIRSYIASDWPSLGQRKELYEEICRLEAILSEKEGDAESEKKVL